MEIDGKHYGSSIGRGLRRHAAEQEGKDKGSDTGGAAGNDQQKPVSVENMHEHANGASRSFHAYQHPDKVHAHAHDHQTGAHEHREHPDIESAAEHMREHMGMGGEPAAEHSEGAEGGMPPLGLGEMQGG